MEPVKSYRKVRCVSIKGDKVTHIPEHLVEELCKSYKMIAQDSGEPVKEDKPDELTLEEAKAEYEKLTGKKAGNKKLETILKEIEEVTNKQ